MRLDKILDQIETSVNVWDDTESKRQFAANAFAAGWGQEKIKDQTEEWKASFMEAIKPPCDRHNAMLNNCRRVLGIKKSHWFDLGEMAQTVCGMTFDELKDASGGERLPFPKTCLTMKWGFEDETSPQGWMAIFCEEIDSDTIELRSVLTGGDTKNNEMCPDVGRLRRVQNEWVPEGDDELFCAFVFTPLLALMRVLSCKNVYIDRELFPQALNKARIKRGSRPGFDRLVIRISGEPKEVSEGDPTGTHQSPRLHFRRGHIRRLPKGNVWVRHCMVGRGPGVLESSYEVAAPQVVMGTA